MQYKNQVNQIHQAKKAKYICSFSDEADNNFCEDLMWVHYANSHCGVKINFKLCSDVAQEVEYTDNIETEAKICSSGASQNLDEILCKKKLCWRYEAESRVISNSNKIHIKILKITLGKKFSGQIISNLKTESEEFEENIKNVARQILAICEKNNYKPEIRAYKTRYSDKAQRITLF